MGSFTSGFSGNSGIISSINEKLDGGYIKIKDASQNIISIEKIDGRDTNNAVFSIPAQDITLDATSSANNGRTDIIYINNNNELKISKGIESNMWKDSTCDYTLVDNLNLNNGIITVMFNGSSNWLQAGRDFDIGSTIDITCANICVAFNNIKNGIADYVSLSNNGNIITATISKYIGLNIDNSNIFSLQCANLNASTPVAGNKVSYGVVNSPIDLKYKIGLIHLPIYSRNGTYFGNVLDQNDYALPLQLVNRTPGYVFNKKIIRNVDNLFGYSIKDFGAIGDGVTDDSYAIQKAIDTGETIYFPSGTYLISNNIYCGNVTNIHFIGNSNQTTILFKDNTQVFSCLAEDSQDVIIENIVFKHTGTRSMYQLFPTTGSFPQSIALNPYLSSFILKNCKLYDCDLGEIFSDYVHIENLQVYNGGVWLQYQTNVYIKNIMLYSNKTNNSPITYPFWINGTSDDKVNNVSGKTHISIENVIVDGGNYLFQILFNNCDVILKNMYGIHNSNGAFNIGSSSATDQYVSRVTVINCGIKSGWNIPTGGTEAFYINSEYIDMINCYDEETVAPQTPGPTPSKPNYSLIIGSKAKQIKLDNCDFKYNIQNQSSAIINGNTINSISVAPKYKGQFSLVDSKLYVAAGIFSVSDWKQI